MRTRRIGVITMSVLAVDVALLVLCNTPPTKSLNRQEATSFTMARPGRPSRSLARIHSLGTSYPTMNQLILPEALPESDDEQVGALADRWARRDPIGAAVWVEELPEGTIKTSVLLAMAAAWAEENPRQAANLVTALELPDGEATNQTVVSVVSIWAMTDPAAAAHWVETFPMGVREYAIEKVAFQWMQSDPAAFMTWAQRLLGTADRDAAINAGVDTLVESDPDLAARLADAIGNTGNLQRQMERAARRWLETDQAAARRWIPGSSLPDEAKQRLLVQARLIYGH